MGGVMRYYSQSRRVVAHLSGSESEESSDDDYHHNHDEFFEMDGGCNTDVGGRLQQFSIEQLGRILERMTQDPVVADFSHMGVHLRPQMVERALAFENGEAFVVKLQRGDGGIINLYVKQDTTVGDLKEDMKAYIHQRQTLAKQSTLISWKYVWKHNCLVHNGQKLLNNTMTMSQLAGMPSSQTRKHKSTANCSPAYVLDADNYGLASFATPFLWEWTPVCTYSTSLSLVAAEFVPGGPTLVALGSDNSLYTLDTATCAHALVGPTGVSLLLHGTALAHSVRRAALYALFWDQLDSLSYLYTIDAAGGGRASPVGVVEGPAHLVALAADESDGALFAVDQDTAVVWRIDPTSAIGWPIDGSDTGGTGTIGFSLGTPVSMSYDACNDVVWFAGANADSLNSELRMVDISTGTSSLMGTFPTTSVDGLAFPEMCAPSESSSYVECNTTETVVDCQSAVVIDSLPFSYQGDTTSAPSSLVSCFSTPKQGVLFSYTPASTVGLNASLCSTAELDTMIYVFTSCCNNGNVYNCLDNDDYCSLQSALQWVGEAQTTYFIFVTGYSDSVGEFSLSLEELPILSCNDAIRVESLPFAYNGSTLGSPMSVIDCFSEQQSHGALFLFAPASNVSVIAQTCGGTTNFDTVIYVYTSCDDSEGGSGCVTSNDDYCRLSSMAMWNAVEYTTYYIVVAGFLSGEGNFTLIVEEGTSGNLDCAAAQDIPMLPYTLSGSLDSATPQTVDCFSISTPGQLVSYTPSTTGTVNANTCNAVNEMDTILYVFSGCETTGDVGTCIARDDDSCGTGSSIDWLAVAGETYYIMITSGTLSLGEYYFLSVSDVEPPISLPGSGSFSHPLDCDSAITVDQLPFTIGGNTTDAPWQEITCFSLYSPGLLFVYTPPEDQSLSASTCTSTDYDTQIYIFSGCQQNEYVSECIAFDDDYCILGSMVEWEGEAGVSYWIFVTGWSSATGSFTLAVLENPPQPQTSEEAPSQFSGYVLDPYFYSVNTFTEPTLRDWTTECFIQPGNYNFIAGDFEELYPGDLFLINTDTVEFYMLSTSSCSLQYFGSLDIPYGDVTGMTWNTIQFGFLVISNDGFDSYLYLLDPETMRVTQLLTITDAVITDIATDPLGAIYAIDYTSQSIGIIDDTYYIMIYSPYTTEYTQSLSYDTCTNRLYFTGRNYYTDNAELWSIDMATWSAQYHSIFPSFMVTALSFGPYCEDSSEDHKKHAVGIAVGVTVGAVAFGCLSAGALFLFGRWINRRKHPPTSPVAMSDINTAPGMGAGVEEAVVAGGGSQYSNQ
ncbi:U11/U12 small nuclear ribonucleoprotein 25 kDa protein [Pelomyxa schiedti]|nr:U11/U12 small nuclear ribonucleoprotein 25 kDa protein [Pelomyxa schiedti]